MNILVTGASGFIGKMLCTTLVNKGHRVVGVVRKSNADSDITEFIVKDLSAYTNFEEALQSIDVLIHLAGRAHVLNDQSSDPYKAYAEINIDVTKNLAIQSIANGVKRFIFISSVGVNGNSTNVPFNENDTPNPQEPYAKSKYLAEVELKKICSASNLEVVIIRPPLVYGRNAKGNFAELVRFCRYKLPLPLGAVNNKRSMVYIENLVDFIVVCATHTQAANEVFFVSDDEDISTTRLIKSVNAALGTNPWLIPISVNILKLVLYAFGKEKLATKLCGNLQLDISKAKTLLGWNPPYSFKQGIEKSIQKTSIN